MHEMPVTEVLQGDRPASMEVPMSVSTRTAPAAPGMGSFALFATIAAGAVLFVAVAFTALTSTPRSTVTPIAAPAPMIHDHGWSASAFDTVAIPAPVVAHDHGWADGSAGIQSAVKAPPYIIHDGSWYDAVYGGGLKPQTKASLRSAFGN
jgi:hypothetical protein